MANTIPSANMNLPIPTVGIDPGTDWALNLNSSLTLLDAHTHTPGSGVPITPGAININAALQINNNAVASIGSLAFLPQSVTPGSSSLYESGSDLYFVDGAGNNIRFTQGGSIAGASGTITGLPSGTASASYAAGTFVLQSATSTSAALDVGSIILRNGTPGSFGLTLSPPNAMGANYGLVLPGIPASQKFMTLDASGNMGAPWAVDGATIEVASGAIVRVKDQGIVTAKIADQSVTQGKLALRALSGIVGGVAISGTSGNYSMNSTTATTVTNLSVSLTTAGRPVQLMLISDGSGAQAQLGTYSLSTSQIQSYFNWVRNGTTLYNLTLFQLTYNSGGNFQMRVPPGSFNTLDFPPAGTWTYSFQVASVITSITTLAQYVQLVAFEI